MNNLFQTADEVLFLSKHKTSSVLGMLLKRKQPKMLITRSWSDKRVLLSFIIFLVAGPKHFFFFGNPIIDLIGINNFWIELQSVCPVKPNLLWGDKKISLKLNYLLKWPNITPPNRTWFPLGMFILPDCNAQNILVVMSSTAHPLKRALVKPKKKCVLFWELWFLHWFLCLCFQIKSEACKHKFQQKKKLGYHKIESWSGT